MINNSIFRRKQQLDRLKTLRKGAKSPAEKSAVSIGDDVFYHCDACGDTVPRSELAKNLFLCPKCGACEPVDAYFRLSLLLDHGSFREFSERIMPRDVLSFPGYRKKLIDARRKSGLGEAVVTAHGKIDGIRVVVGVMDTRFMMSSMGTAVGEKITRAVELAHREKLPLILFCCGGGARMQEGIFSLMQMAKTAAALQRFSGSGGLYISYLTHPTTGGITASFASLGDITLAEPGALIGFAGPRVIEQTIGQTLPEGFQTAEFLQQHGFIDAIVPRSQMKETLAQLLRLHREGGK